MVKLWRPYVSTFRTALKAALLPVCRVLAKVHQDYNMSRLSLPALIFILRFGLKIAF